MKWIALLGFAMVASTVSAQENPAPPAAAAHTAPSRSQEVQSLLPPAAAEVFVAQVMLDRAGYSTGEIDGRMGRNVKGALTAFQMDNGLAATGRLDPRTSEALNRAAANAPPLTTYTISEADVAGPFTPSIPSDLTEQAKLDSLGYTGPDEALAERFHISPELLHKLNPGTTLAMAGTQLLVPNVEPFEWGAREESRARGTRRASGGPSEAQTTRARNTSGAKTAASSEPSGVTIYVTKSTSALTVEKDGRVVFRAPVTSGSTHDPLPIGEWKVTGVHRNPVFFYNPDLFWDADPTDSKAKIPAGPNNPVGVVWIDLSKEHYGIHGTPGPSQIGHVQSHGCVRLTNWDAARVAGLAQAGTPVIFRE